MTHADFQAAIQRAIPAPTAQQRALAARAQTDCATCLGTGLVDIGRGDTEYLVACACTDGAVDEAPEPVPTRRRYTFAVYLEVPEAVDADDIDGYTRADVEAIVTRCLDSYASPLDGRAYRTVGADWELMESEIVGAASGADAHADDRPADWMYHDMRCGCRRFGLARRACDCGL